MCVYMCAMDISVCMYACACVRASVCNECMCVYGCSLQYVCMCLGFHMYVSLRHVYILHKHVKEKE